METKTEVGGYIWAKLGLLGLITGVQTFQVMIIMMVMVMMMMIMAGQEAALWREGGG